MDYEKAYKNLVAKVKNAHLFAQTDSTKNVLEDILPELRESEDERIRKVLIKYFKGSIGLGVAIDGIGVKDILAWLEKQKEQKPADDEAKAIAYREYERGRESGLRDGQKYVLDNAESYVLCKPAEWSEKHIAGIFEKVGLAKIVREQGNDELTNALQDAMIELSKVENAEWSEEDTLMLTAVIQTLERFGGRGTTGMQIDWLKSLRPQPQGTYKLIVHNIYEMLKDKDFFDITPSHRVSLLNDIRVRCKNADEQAEILDAPSWKPSEEQMEELWNVISYIEKPGSNFLGVPALIESLYEQLKKL